MHSVLQSKVQLLQGEIQRKDASLQATLSEKAGIEQSLDLSRKELGKAKQQLTEMSAQYNQNIEKLHSIQQRIDAKDAEITGLAHQVYTYIYLHMFTVFAYSLCICYDFKYEYIDNVIHLNFIHYLIVLSCILCSRTFSNKFWGTIL